MSSAGAGEEVPALVPRLFAANIQQKGVIYEYETNFFDRTGQFRDR